MIIASSYHTQNLPIVPAILHDICLITSSMLNYFHQAVVVWVDSGPIKGKPWGSGVVRDRGRDIRSRKCFEELVWCVMIGIIASKQKRSDICTPEIDVSMAPIRVVRPCGSAVSAATVAGRPFEGREGDELSVSSELGCHVFRDFPYPICEQPSMVGDGYEIMLHDVSGMEVRQPHRSAPKLFVKSRYRVDS